MKSTIEPAIRTLRDLIVWRDGIELAKEIYRLAERLPKDETYALVSQLKRAAISIPSNIAEGHSRGHRREYRQFVHIAVGSLAEMETQLVLTRELHVLPENELSSIFVRVDRLRAMLVTLGKKLA
jgi:four helix bundle protein